MHRILLINIILFLVYLTLSAIMFSKLTTLVTYVTLMLVTQTKGVYSYPSYNGNVPNGNMVPPSAIALGHPMGNVNRYTPFANAYVSNGRKWSLALCKADSDGDGQSNGLELGDPCCKWVVGSAPMFVDGLSDPNDPASTTTHTNQTCM